MFDKIFLNVRKKVLICIMQMIICMVRITFVHIDTIFSFNGYIFSFFFVPIFTLSSTFEHNCVDTFRFGCLICMCFVYLCLKLFSAIEHVSRGKVL